MKILSNGRQPKNFTCRIYLSRIAWDLPNGGRVQAHMVQGKQIGSNLLTNHCFTSMATAGEMALKIARERYGPGHEFEIVNPEAA